MTDATAEDGEAAEGEGQAPAKKRWSGKRLVIFIGAPVVLLLIIGGAAWFFLFHHASGEPEVKKVVPKVVVFLDLPDMLVNLNAGGKHAAYLKLKVSLELSEPLAIPKLTELLPRIIDNFQVYLRELRPEDLAGSAGLYRLKEELLFRVNAAVQPIVVDDVLFKEMLIQ